jgi:transcriptional regulator with XRE-family HTH domain
MNVKSLVGWNLRRMRLEKAISQEALGLLVGCEPSYVGRIERGTENTTIETLGAFAEALDVNIAGFFVEPADPKTALPTLKPGRKPKRA